VFINLFAARYVVLVEPPHADISPLIDADKMPRSQAVDLACSAKNHGRIICGLNCG
jgi:hypothetical protein